MDLSLADEVNLSQDVRSTHDQKGKDSQAQGCPPITQGVVYGVVEFTRHISGLHVGHGGLQLTKYNGSDEEDKDYSDENPRPTSTSCQCGTQLGFQEKTI